METGVLIAVIVAALCAGISVGMWTVVSYANGSIERAKWNDSKASRATREFNRSTFDTMLREVHTHMLSDWELSEDAYYSIIKLHFSNGYTIVIRSRPVGFTNASVEVPNSAEEEHQTIKAPGNLTGMISRRNARALDELVRPDVGKVVGNMEADIRRIQDSLGTIEEITGGNNKHG